MDTNTLVRALADEDSPSAKIVRLCEDKRIQLLLSKPVLAEYRQVLSYPKIRAQFPSITQLATELVLRRLRYLSDYSAKVRARFHFDRDPRDEKFIELALHGGATHLITHDLDLLSLATEHTDAAKRFRQRLPGVWITKSAEFVRAWKASEN